MLLLSSYLTAVNRKYFAFVGTKLGNQELIDLAKNSMIETGNTVQYINMLDKYSNVSEVEINFAAEGFDEINSDELMTVCPDYMEDILTMSEDK